MLRVLTTTTAMLIALPVLAQTADGTDAAPDAGTAAESQTLSADAASEGAPMGMGETLPDASVETAPEPVAPMPAAPVEAPADPGADLTAPAEVTPAEPVSPAPEFAPSEPVPADAFPEPAADAGQDLMGTPPMDVGTPAVPSSPPQTLPADAEADISTPAEPMTQTPADALTADPTATQTDPMATPTPDPMTADPASTPMDPVATPDAQSLADALSDETAAAAGATPSADPQTPIDTATDPMTDEGAPAEALAGQTVAEPDPANTAALSEEASGEVTETVVSETLARSSDEEFRTRVNDGLSDDAKNILFGLGGFALGHVLADRSTVEANTGDRIIVREPDGDARVIKNDDAILVMPGYQVRTEDFDDGSSRSVILRPDGSQVITIRDAELRVLSRRVVRPDGSSVVIVDQTVAVPPVDVRALPLPAAIVPVVSRDEDELRRALTAAVPVDRVFSLNQVLTIREVRALAVPVGVTDITFATGSAAITPDQARSLLALGNVIRDMIARNPSELFLIEGHTDSVGDELMNLTLSDRRAESLAKALTEHFKVPAENLVVQGYGERYLLVPQGGDIRENRRAAVRRITPLISGN